MAGEKLSARQKMIGMMYLVLTALLALQVSSSVLEKFILIIKSLERGVASKMAENAKSLERIQTIVKETGSRKEDVNVLQTALKVREKTRQTISYIEGLKEKLIKLSGGKKKKTGVPKGLKNDSVVARMMINEKKGREQQKIINGYIY